jgi:glycosyltransferase involved in cell wall biosynthesis
VKVLFAQNMLHIPAYGGANKANRVFAELLAAQGHECQMIAPVSGALDPGAEVLSARLARYGVTDWQQDDEAIVYDLAGVRVHGVISPSKIVRRIRSVAAELRPDWIIVPSDDPAGMVLASALASAPARVIYIAHTIQQVPLGPAAFYPSTAMAKMLHRVAGVLAPSRAAADYLRDWAGVTAELIYPPVYAPAPARKNTGRPGSVTLINPCAYKGLPIFLRLADELPDVPFLAVPTWGTTEQDLAQLRQRPNIEITTPADDINEILCRTRVLLMPSLWDETFGFSCVDAMLQGIPVLASDVGGLGEAKLGVPYLLPVQRIELYNATADPARPAPIIPEQDVAPWRNALRRLIEDRGHFDDLAGSSRQAAMDFVASIDSRALETYLLARLQAPVGGVAP